MPSTDAGGGGNTSAAGAVPVAATAVGAATNSDGCAVFSAAMAASMPVTALPSGLMLAPGSGR